jgi:hypothetical protein
MERYTMEKSRNAFAVAKSMGHVDLKSMEPYQHQELEPLREAINQRNQRKKLGQVLVRFSKINQIEQANLSRYLIDGIRLGMVDAVGIEPTTCRLRVECSAS